VWSGGNNASGWNIGTHYSEFWADNQEGSLRGEPGWERGVEFRKAEWNHLVVTYDGAHVREHINGQQSAEIHGTGRRVGNGVPMVVGSWMGFQFHGALDEVRIHRRALKVMEIQALHRTTTSLLAEPKLQAFATITTFSADPVPPEPSGDFKDFRVDRADFIKILDSYFTVNRDQWLHHYSHVAFGDRTGTAALTDGTALKWLVRPGGLATVTLPDGTTLYLAASKPK
jgi:hypothetical protein